MKKISDERLEKMLTNYCEADTEQTFTFEPEKKREKLVPFVRFRKQIIAAASLVLVSVLSLIIYFSFGNINNTPLTVAPSHQRFITPSSTEGGGGGDPDQQDDNAQNGSKSLLQRIYDFFFPNDPDDTFDGTSPTEHGGASSSALSTEKGGLTAGHSSRRNPPTVPSATQPSGTPSDTLPEATEADDPTPISETPTEPDAPPYVPPTIPMDPPWDDPEPTDPPGEGDEPWLIPPTEGSTPYEYATIEWVPMPTGSGVPQGELIVTFEENRLNADGLVYCKLFDNHKNYGTMLGHPNQFDASHAAVVTGNYYSEQYGWLTTASYILPEGLVSESGNYYVVFYNSSGRYLGRMYVDL